MIETRQLRYFLAVAEAGSFGRAARALYISQPPLSRQIRKLEQSVGAELFDRVRDGVRLTDAGRVLYEESGRLLGQVERAVQLSRRAARGEIATLCIGWDPYLDLSLKPRLLRSIHRAHPDWNIGSRNCAAEDQMALIRQRALDAGVVRLPLPDFDGLRLELLCHEPLVLMVRDAHPLARKRRVSLADLEAESLVILSAPTASAYYDHLTRMCTQAGIAAGAIRQNERMVEILQAVLAGEAVGLLPESVRRMKWRGVKFSRLKETYAETAIGMICGRDDHSSAVSSLLQIAREVPLDWFGQSVAGERLAVVA